MWGILRLSVAPSQAGRTRVARVHRTTTTATLLVTVAVSALSGCTTVPHPSAPTPSTAPSRPSAPQPEGEAETQVVQAPAREALQLIEEVSHRPKPAASPSHPAPTPPAVSPEHGTSQPGHHDARPRPARPERPGPAPHSPQRSHPALRTCRSRYGRTSAAASRTARTCARWAGATGVAGGQPGGDDLPRHLRALTRRTPPPQGRCRGGVHAPGPSSPSRDSSRPMAAHRPRRSCRRRGRGRLPGPTAGACGRRRGDRA